MIDADIHIGDVFSFKTHVDNQWVLYKAIIIKIDNENWFHACAFLENSDREALNTRAVGDMVKEYIEEVVDHWNLERLLQAAKAGGEITGFQWPKEELERIRKEMEEPSHREKL